MIYRLTKLSSGDVLHIETNDFVLIYEILEKYCCDRCLSEVLEQVEYNYNNGTTTDIDNKFAYLLSTQCGTEFFYEEKDNEE